MQCEVLGGVRMARCLYVKVPQRPQLGAKVVLKLDAMLVHWYPHGLEDVLAVHYAVALKNVEQFNRKNVGRTLQFRARKHQRGRISLPGPPGEDRREGVERCRGKLAKNA